MTTAGVETLRRDPEFLLSRSSQGPLRLEAISEPLSLRSLERIEHEYALRDQLDPAWAARPRAITRESGRPALLLEDPGGELLVRMMGQPWALGVFLRVAAGLAASLGRLHERGLIHKDIKPGNIFVDAAHGWAWLTGFGIASLVPRERRTPDPPAVISGTLAYMAPEQTGRMNRSLDSRGDLYAFGVVLYELLTGGLPFSAADTTEWIHCHIARQPLPPSQRVPSVPEPVAAIVMKLLAKSAEERYQTAAGVEADLRRCLRAWESTGTIRPFTPGADDISERLVIPERLYGREGDIDTLLQAFGRVVRDGTPELVLVSGHPGIGKSSVVNELHKALVPRRGLFAAGKFEQYKRDIPYATLGQALAGLVRTILGGSEVELEGWRGEIARSLGANGQLLVDLIPDLELVIGKQPAVPGLPPQDAQNRFQMVFVGFLGVFARPEHPLAMFLDDLQWLDPASLKIIEHVVCQQQLRHFLLIGAYRDNEAGPDHPATLAFDKMRRSGAAVHEIVLAPLAPDEVRRLVADTLRCSSTGASSLAALVHDKTGGNPFFAIQFLGELAADKMVLFDRGAAAWTWDEARVRARNYTDNVVELITAKLNRLPDHAKDALKQLACLGNVADVATLARVLGGSEDAAHAAMWEAVRAGVVWRSHGGYAFLHDHVHEAAYLLLPEEARQQVHLRIGRLLLENISAEPTAEYLFGVLDQLGRVIGLIEDAGERATLLRLHVAAGERARSAIAHAAASGYFGQAASLLEPDAWTASYQQTFDLFLAWAECEYLLGRFEHAGELFGLCLARARSNAERAKVYGLRLRLYQLAGKYAEGLAVGLEGLRQFGVVLSGSEEELNALAGEELRQIAESLRGRSIAGLADSPLASDLDTRALIGLLMDTVPCAYIAGAKVFPLLVLTPVRLSLLHGSAPQSGVAYSGYAVMLIGVLGDIPAGFEFSQMALALNDRCGARRLRGLLLHMHGNHVHFWRRPFAECEAILEEAFDTCLEMGDLVYASYIAFEKVWQWIERGEPLERVQEEAVRSAAFTQRSHNHTIHQVIRLEQQFVAALQGRTAQPLSLAGPGFDEEAVMGGLAAARFQLGLFLRHVMRQMLAFGAARPDEALAAARAAEPLLPAVLCLPIEATFHFYRALSVAALHGTAAPEQRGEYRRIFDADLARMARWAAACPDNFADRHALLLAEEARLDGRDLDAMRGYEQAVAAARRNGFVQHEALAFELAARFHAARGLDTIARDSLRHARDAYLRWGAHGKVWHIDRSSPHPGGELSAATIGTPIEELDLATVVRVSQAISGDIILEKLIDTLMVTALEHAGAGRGLLVLPSGAELRVEAEATTGARVEVRLRPAGAELPRSLLHYVARTRERVILDDAVASAQFSGDPYFGRHRCRSVLCLPLVKQARLIGLLYLENNLTPRAFTPARMAVLELLAPQAAIALENARLYSDLREENRVRQQAEEALRRSEAYLAKAQRLSRTGSFGWNVSSGEIVWSDETFRIYGYEQGVTVPTLERIFARIHPEDAVLARQVVTRASRAGEDFESEVRLVMPDGTVKHTHILAQAVGGPGAAEFVGAVMDVSATKELVQGIAFRDQVMGILSHDLRNPLSAVLGIAGLMRWDTRLSDPAREQVAQIERAARRMREMIEALLDFTQTRFAGKLPIQPGPTDLREVCGGVVAELLAGHPRRDIELEVRAACDGSWDAGRIAQVLSNLLGNALMHGDPGAPVRLSIDGDAAEVVLAVHNRGQPIAPATIPVLFEPFRRGGEDRWSAPRGLGLGLHIAKQIVLAHGGSISVQSSSEEGTTFRVSLPRGAGLRS